MHKKFEISQTKIKAGCQSGRKVVLHNSKNVLPLGAVIRKKYLFFHVCLLSMSPNKERVRGGVSTHRVVDCIAVIFSTTRRTYFSLYSTACWEHY